MQRAQGSACAVDAAAAAVAPLLQLKRAAQKAHRISRFARAVELCERALAAAEPAQLRNSSLISAALLHELSIAHQNMWLQTKYDNTLTDASGAAMAAEAAELRKRSLHPLHARWQAGTLFSPTVEEVAYLLEDEYPHLPAQMCGAFFYVHAAEDVVQQQQQDLTLCTPAEAEARLQAVYGALRAALEMDARGMLERNPRTGQAWPPALPMAASDMVLVLKGAVHDLVTAALCEDAGILHHMRATCGLSAAEETALRQLAERNKATADHVQRQLPKEAEDVTVRLRRTAAADMARHGLRRCALPSCDAQEPHPKLFKLCGRCRSAAYCCAAHSVEDWKRHKRDDGCAAAP
jgi:hypothetical protein